MQAQLGVLPPKLRNVGLKSLIIKPTEHLVELFCRDFIGLLRTRLNTSAAWRVVSSLPAISSSTPMKSFGRHGILVSLADRPRIDQTTVAKLLGLDRSTTRMVIKKLEQAGLLGRAVGVEDRRRSLRMTAAGERTVQALKGPAQRARTRLLSAFEPAERELFLRLLDKFTRRFNESTRVPLEGGARAKPLSETARGGDSSANRRRSHVA
jgi:DNA-binding MarR family transcriptional regulator